MNHSNNESKVKQAAANGEPPIGIPWEAFQKYNKGEQTND